MEVLQSWIPVFRIVHNDAALVGKAIGGLGALMYLGYMGWQMAAGDREWEITPMLKPILIGFT
jgi:hypothetical protein